MGSNDNSDVPKKQPRKRLLAGLICAAACLVIGTTVSYDLHTLIIGSKQTFRGHTGGVSSVAFSPDGSRIVSGSSGAAVKVWDVSSGEEILTLGGHSDSVHSVAFSPDGSRSVSGGGDL